MTVCGCIHHHARDAAAVQNTSRGLMSHTAFRQSLACVSLLYRHEQGTNISTPLPNGITLYPTQGYADSSGADRRKDSLHFGSAHKDKTSSQGAAGTLQLALREVLPKQKHA
jgi:hypothetical protein